MFLVLQHLRAQLELLSLGRYINRAQIRKQLVFSTIFALQPVQGHYDTTTWLITYCVEGKLENNYQILIWLCDD